MKFTPGSADTALRQPVPELTAIEEKVLQLLMKAGHALWPERPLQPQGAAVAAGGILRRLAERGLVGIGRDGPIAQYHVTVAGASAHTAAHLARIDHRQLSLPI